MKDKNESKKATREVRRVKYPFRAIISTRYLTLHFTLHTSHYEFFVSFFMLP
jgi:hypothetical protein